MHRATSTLIVGFICIVATPAAAQPERIPTPPQSRVVVTPPAVPAQSASVAAAPAVLSRIWAVPNMRAHRTMSGSTATACVVVSNFNASSVRVGIGLVDQNGVAAWDAERQDLAVARGGTVRHCIQNDDSREELTFLVAATAPVAVMGYVTVTQPDRGGDNVASNFSYHHPGVAYPVDCARPLNFEYVCDTVSRRVIAR